MSTDGTDGNGGLGDAQPAAGELIETRNLRDEMQESYLTYAMSVIISRALPDARDGLKPSQRRILVAMNDLRLGPNSSRVKCAKISGDTSGNYHPHGDGSIYPTLVRLAQTWVMRETLIDKQGNFGSLAGLPPAAMRYTEARLSSFASEMLQDIDRDTVDFVPTYDQRNSEPVVLPTRLPNLVVNGSNGIAVGMATSIPPHNAGETCAAVIKLIDNPECSLGELMQALPGPDFPTGGIICGRYGIRQGYLTGRSTITLRARTHFDTEKNSDVIVITEIPYLETRDRIREKLEQLVRDDKIKGISRVIDLTDRKLPEWQVRLHIVLKRDADKDVVLAQLFQFSPLQSTISVILLALVGNRPQLLTIKELLQQFLRHRVDVLRRRTEFLLAEARKRKHTVEGLLIAQLNIDEVIATIRNAASRADAKEALQRILVPGEFIGRALGEVGYRVFQDERGIAENYSLSATQAEAVVSMQLGSLAGLERDKLGDEYRKILEEIIEYLRLLSDEANLIALVREELVALQGKYSDKRRTEISEEELGEVNMEDLIEEQTVVVTLSYRGYIKRMELGAYKAQNRGGRGVYGAKTEDDDPIQDLFVCSTHDYLLFFTDQGKVYWQKVYDIPAQSRTAKGRAIVNLLQLAENEKVMSCLAVRDFDDVRQLVMATRKGIVKKTVLSAYSRPRTGGLIAISLQEGDELIDVVIVSPKEDLILSTANGMVIRFSEDDARSMGRDTRGVKGISLKKDDYVVGMVVASPELDLVTVCENGYGKRTPIGAVSSADVETPPEGDNGEAVAESGLDVAAADLPSDTAGIEPAEEATEGEASASSSMQYRRQRRGGMGLRDIRTSDRNGKAVDILAVTETDEILMVTAGGIIQRVRVSDIRRIGRNTQGVRMIRLAEGDKLVSMARVPQEDVDETGILPSPDSAPVVPPPEISAESSAD